MKSWLKHLPEMYLPRTQNNCTFRFYGLQKWERRQEAIRMGEQPAATGDSFNFKNDEENLR